MRILAATMALLPLLAAGCGGSDGGTRGPIFFEGYESAIYSDDAHWLCKKDLPGDVCDRNLDATIVEQGGALSVEPHVVAERPRFDCFYAYPTTDLGQGGNSPFDGQYDEEIYTARVQAARFGELCEVYAPVYRQRTLTAPRGPAVDYSAVAYADVLDAFRYYMGNLNEGRPFVLIGHSQGAGHLTRLVAQEIDPNPALREQMISALLLGTTVAVPIGGDVGGSFQAVPACRTPDQFGCVVSYASFRDTAPPPPTSFFARVDDDGMQALCTNPADLSGGSAPLVPYFNIAEDSQFGVANPRLAWAPNVVDPPAISTPFVALPGLVSSRCVFDGEFSYLELHVNADPSDPRADNIGGDATPEWGMHLVDASVALGSLVDLVESQAAAWHDAH